MREDICTIPVSEVFEPRDGCPLCRMRDLAEERALDYVLGAAMMEPDVRQVTNRLGFCAGHYGKMQGVGKRLPLALMLESHLDELIGAVKAGGLLGPPAKKAAYRTARLAETCFVCERMEWGISRMVATIYRLYESESDFRALFTEQPALCLPHFTMLVEGSDRHLKSRRLGEFQRDCKRITLRGLESLRGDISHFCRMFDYRNNTPDADWGNARDAVERTIGFLSGNAGAIDKK